MTLTPEIIYGVGAAVLLVAMIYGLVRYATRDKSKDRRTESATRILYNSRTRDDDAEPPAPDEIAAKQQDNRPGAPR
jgi:hypothetical protein